VTSCVPSRIHTLLNAAVETFRPFETVAILVPRSSNVGAF
jgi:hypothetical protein